MLLDIPEGGDEVLVVTCVPLTLAACANDDESVNVVPLLAPVPCISNVTFDQYGSLLAPATPYEAISA